MKLALHSDASFCEVTKVDSAASTEKRGSQIGWVHLLEVAIA